jgi:hypothetical protein
MKNNQLVPKHSLFVVKFFSNSQQICGILFGFVQAPQQFDYLYGEIKDDNCF